MAATSTVGFFVGGELLLDYKIWIVADQPLGTASTPCERLGGSLVAVLALGAPGGSGKAKSRGRNALGRCKGPAAIAIAYQQPWPRRSMAAGITGKASAQRLSGRALLLPFMRALTAPVSPCIGSQAALGADPL